MENDDAPVGRVLSRREAVSLIGVSGLAVLGARYLGAQHPRGHAATAAAAPRAQIAACVVRPQQTEGPYFVDEKLHRADIRADPADGSVRPGAPLDLTLNVSRIVAGACVPVAGAYVDIWQCDHSGVYSGVRDAQFDTRGKKFLRGYQVTDAGGNASFVTIYPGWYRGRAVHIHFKVRSAPTETRGYEFTSQLYFDDAVTDAVHALEPYAAMGSGRISNERDGIYRRQGGRSLMLDVLRKDDRFQGTFNLALS
jgi:protocatechuate 3,4-dioxygenase beta subunit